MIPFYALEQVYYNHQIAEQKNQKPLEKNYISKDNEKKKKYKK
jgi:hypothetical protein